MKNLSNLQRINNYLAAFSIAAIQCGWHFVTDQGDATTLLDKLGGDRVLFARPELRQIANEADGWKDTVDTAVFVLAKTLGNGRTADKENAQFARLLDIADAVVSKMREDITGGGCSALSGVTITSVQIAPEAMIFGGWQGWSIDITFDC